MMGLKLIAVLAVLAGLLILPGAATADTAPGCCVCANGVAIPDVPKMEECSKRCVAKGSKGKSFNAGEVCQVRRRGVFR
jgi:hypothetical protein